MSNPKPTQTDEFKATQFKPTKGEPLGKIIGTRYPEPIQDRLLAIDNYQEFIRKAVADALEKLDEAQGN